MNGAAFGRNEPMPLMTLVDMLDEYGYKQHHVAYNALGSKIGLKGVATVMSGPPEDGRWWNLRVGYMPEKTVWIGAEEEDFGDVAEFFMSLGMSEAQAVEKEWTVRKRGRRPRFLGWRNVLYSLVNKRVVRPNPIAEEWLGSEQYERALRNKREALRV